MNQDIVNRLRELGWNESTLPSAQSLLFEAADLIESLRFKQAPLTVDDPLTKPTEPERKCSRCGLNIHRNSPVGECTSCYIRTVRT